MRPNACRTSQENKKNTVFHGFFVLTFRGHWGIHYKKLKDKDQSHRTELYPSIHAEIKLQHFLVKEDRNANTTPAFALLQQRWSRRTLQF